MPVNGDVARFHFLVGHPQRDDQTDELEQDERAYRKNAITQAAV